MMGSPKRMLNSVFIFIQSFFMSFCILLDHFRTVKNLNKRRLEEVRSDERKMVGKVVVVTGSNSGIGKMSSMELSRRGAKVIMACRDHHKAEMARQDILEAIPNANLEIMNIDMADLQSIYKFVGEFKSRYSHLDVLVNNAGIFSVNFTFTKHGFEKHIGVNYLGTFLLTLLLLDLLKKAENGRQELLNLDNIMMKDQQLGPFTAYSNSKLCVAIFSKKLAKLLCGTHVTTYALCTGLVRTNLVRDEGKMFYNILFNVIHKLMAVPFEQGCATLLHCILSKSLEKETGQFYKYLTTWKPADRIISRFDGEKLWKLSESLVGLDSFHLDSLGEVSSENAL